MTARLSTLTAIGLSLWLTACSRPATPEPQAAHDALPTLDVTHWTATSELFMEYPPLVAQQKALFAIHLTRLADFAPVTAGRARLEFTPASGGAATNLVGPKPSRPGAFRVEDVPPSPGRYTWALVLESPDLTDRHDLGTITVFPDVATAQKDAGEGQPDDAAAIAYLKEQQWTNPFATTAVVDGEVRHAVRATASIHPLPGGEALVAAPAAGRFRADRLVSIGDLVTPGQILGHVEPRLAGGVDRATLVADTAEARIAVEAAQAELARAERLVAEKAVPGRRAEDARRALSLAETRQRAADARLTQRDETLRSGGGAGAGNAFAVRAPLAGRLADVRVTLGAAYEEGAPLFRIVRTDRVELEVQVPPPDVQAARGAVGVAIELPGVPAPLVLEPHHVHDPGVIDPTSRALPLQMEVDNPGGQLLIGQPVTAVLYTNARERLPVVPSAAVLVEAGRPYVFVQEGGEQFVRRFIDIAARDGDSVGVRSGVKPGDRVVTRGAYDVQLASAAKGLPAEGHVH
ncbi:MAG: efflux RND transporter periplasmic adaptor subunit [Vicinamibacterales bacterium]